MAIYYESVCVYIDLIDEGLADGMYRIFAESPGKRVTAIARSYTIMALDVSELTVVARLEGRYAALPDIGPDDDDIAIAEPAPRLMTRDEARLEAQELLKSFNLINHD